MPILVFPLLMALSLFVFAFKGKAKYAVCFLLALAGVTVSGYMAVDVLLGNQPVEIKFSLLSLGDSIVTLDRLSAFFIILVNIAIVVAFLYSRDYLKGQPSSNKRLSMHYLSYLWLYFSMVLVLLFRDAYSFLFAWELMMLTSFLLIVFGEEQRRKLKAAVNYLVQMHIGFFMVLAAFILVKKETGAMSFDALGVYFSSNPNMGLFLLFFAGFGIKAGFIPLHTWLPDVYSVTPGNVSGFVSGAVTKMGIYGLARVLGYIQADYFSIGLFLLLISIATGLFGIFLSIVQKDIKRLLAYSSIENMGIVGIGFGLGILGKAYNVELLAICGFAGALLHTFNHSLFKSLLFYTTSSLCRATGTQNMELMGGAAKRMPYTSGLFLLGSMAICALPPFNGFISEFIIYSGAFSSLVGPDKVSIALMIGAIVTLALIGGLSIIAFTKAFGISFLGEPRSAKAAAVKEASKGMYRSLVILALLIVAIGLFPMVFIRPLCIISGESLRIDYANTFIHTQDLLSTLGRVSAVSMVFIIVVAVLYLIRRRALARRKVEYGPTWGCGFTAPTAKQQYTSSSYVSDFAHLMNPITHYDRVMEPIKEEEIFPANRKFKGRESDVLSNTLIRRPLKWVNERFFRLAIFQTGKIQHYVLYALFFMMLVFVLSYIGWL